MQMFLHNIYIYTHMNNAHAELGTHTVHLQKECSDMGTERTNVVGFCSGEALATANLVSNSMKGTSLLVQDVI